MSAQPIATIYDPSSVALAPMRLGDIADVAAAHRQRHHARDRKPTIHFQKEGGYTLHRGLAPEQQHVVFGMPEVA